MFAVLSPLGAPYRYQPLLTVTSDGTTVHNAEQDDKCARSPSSHNEQRSLWHRIKPIVASFCSNYSYLLLCARTASCLLPVLARRADRHTRPDRICICLQRQQSGAFGNQIHLLGPDANLESINIYIKTNIMQNGFCLLFETDRHCQRRSIIGASAATRAVRRNH